MIHKRIITLDGDECWINNTISKSLPEGTTENIFGAGRKITIETIEGIQQGYIPTHKPERRFETEEK